MIILDTNVLSELTREKPDERVLAWVQAQRSSDLVTTSITKAEIFYGLENMDSGLSSGLFSNAERAEDRTEQIVRRVGASNFTERLLRMSQLFGSQLTCVRPIQRFCRSF